MLLLKKYFLEGLIQMVILLSLCGVKVFVGMDQYLPGSRPNLIQGQPSAQLRNLFNHLHPKSVDLRQFFTARRLLGWVHSVDPLQVPQTELETWLVQQEPGPLIRAFPDQPSLMDSTPDEIVRVQSESTMEQRDVPGSLDEEEEGEERIDGERQCQSSFSENTVSSNTLPESQPLILNLELQWQDLMDILEPGKTNVETMTSLSHTPESRRLESAELDEYEATHQNPSILGAAGTAGHQTDTLIRTFLLHGTSNQLEEEPSGVLLPLTPSDELDVPSSALNTEVSLEISSMDYRINYTDMVSENPLEDKDSGMTAEDNFTTFNMNLFTHNFVHLTPGEGNMSDLKTPSNSFVLAEEEAEGIPSQISDILEDFNILEDIQLFDGASEERLIEMEAMLEEGYLQCEEAHQDTDRNGGWIENRKQPDRQEDGRLEKDSDSSLPLDLLHSHSSSIVSKGSEDDSSSSCVSAVEKLCDEERSAESDLEVEVTIKQKEVEQEEMGAVGALFHSQTQPGFSANHKDYKLFHGFSWLEHIDHDHTYNNPPLSSVFSPAHRVKLSKQTKSAERHNRARPYQRSSSGRVSETKLWNRDEQRARALTIPFSYELIVNLPVEEFNDLLTNYQLSKEQLSLIRDIRRRGKNKVAAQNCRRRKQGVLLALQDDLRELTCLHSQLLHEKRNSLRRLQDIKSRFEMLYREISSKLMDDKGRPLDATEYWLPFAPSDTVTVASLRANQNSITF